MAFIDLLASLTLLHLGKDQASLALRSVSATLSSLTLLHLGKAQASLALRSVSATFGRKPDMTKNRFMIYALY
ncbi:MAG: hypothetical protein MJZ99_10785, partial [Bacteroidales bacterium]|nr:hypothetical protein [Bacteroidales bacterium]